MFGPYDQGSTQTQMVSLYKARMARRRCKQKGLFLVVIFLFQVAAVQIHLDVDDMKICISLVDHWGDVFGLISLV